MVISITSGKLLTVFTYTYPIELKFDFLLLFLSKKIEQNVRKSGGRISTPTHTHTHM